MTPQRETDDQYCASKRSHADRASNGDPRRHCCRDGELGPVHLTAAHKAKPGTYPGRFAARQNASNSVIAVSWVISQRPP
jgi:hypothetical protein